MNILVQRTQNKKLIRFMHIIIRHKVLYYMVNRTRVILYLFGL